LPVSLEIDILWGVRCPMLNRYEINVEVAYCPMNCLRCIQ
jgi:hypothetical protein